MLERSLVHNMMNNSFDPNQILQLQRLLAAQQAQRGFDPAAGSGGNPLLDQYLLSNLHDRFPLTHSHPTALEFAAAGAMNPSPNYGMLQAMMRMNNERANADRERFLFAERANQERALISDRIAQQERLIVTNERALKRQFHENLEHGDAVALLQHEAAMRERDTGETFIDRKVDPAAVQDVKPKKQKVAKPRQPKKKQDTKWLASYRELQEYKTEYGDCIVPRGFPLNPRLAS